MRMKKVLLASIMVGLILATIVHVNAVSVQKRKVINEETTGTYKLRVNVIDEYWWPKLIGGIDFAKVVVTSEDNPFFKRVGWTLFGVCYFPIPDEYEYPMVNAYKSGWEQTRVVWYDKNEVDILMKYTGRNLNNQQQNNLQINPQLSSSSQQTI